MKKSFFKCSNCLQSYVKWNGYCFNCKEYNTIQEIDNFQSNNNNAKKPLSISEIIIDEAEQIICTKINEIDRVLGGGIVRGSVLLLCGNPGVGKSTFLLELLSSLSGSCKILYISTEESDSQVKGRFVRLKNKKDGWYFLKENNFDVIIASIESFSPNFVIIDSLQNIFIDEQDYGGSISKLRYFMQKLVNHAKELRYVLWMTGHITKDGTLAGPKVLEHLVDTVLYLEPFGDSNVRVLRSTKNRFGSIDETGFFIMTEDGLKEYENPQEIFIENMMPSVGSAITWISEGSRPFLIEVQTLLNKTKNPSPARIMYGVESKQFLVLCAVLEKYLKIPLYQFDIFCKVVSSFKVRSPHIDLALIASILSSYKNKASKKKVLYHGEVNLSGNIVSKYSIPKSLDISKYGIELIITAQKDFNKNIDYFHQISSIFDLIV